MNNFNYKFKITFIILVVLLIVFCIGLKNSARAEGLAISAEDINIKLDQTVTVAWDTNIEAFCSIDYSENSDLSNGTGANGTMVEEASEYNNWRFQYERNLENLKDNKNYYYRINCTMGDLSASTNIYNLNMFDIERDLTVSINENKVDENLTASITWNTNIEASCRINFSEESSLENSTRIWGETDDENYGDNYYFEAMAEDLKINTYYYYEVVCIIGEDTLASEIQTLDMYEEEEAFLLSVDENYINPSDLTASIYWDTTVEANCSLKFNEGYDELEQSTSIPGLITQYASDENDGKYHHYLKLENLKENAEYFYKITCEKTSEVVEIVTKESDIKTLKAGSGDDLITDPIIDPTTDPAIDPTTDPAIDPTTDPAIDPTMDTTVDSDTTNNDTTNIVLTKEEEDAIFRQKAFLLSNNDIDTMLEEIQETHDNMKEDENKEKYLLELKNGIEGLDEQAETAINNFITYGVDDNTKRLGAGERAAVIYSFKDAFNKLPETENELTDVIRIANGRWPGERSDEVEKKAKEQFRKIYKRIANMSESYDDAAITVMAYGLRQKAENRNLESEKNGIVIFKDIYGYHPDSTKDWNIMQSITYSGAARHTDSDGDFLTDEREEEFGSDPNNPDSDGDGYLDGIEVENNYDPMS